MEYKEIIYAVNDKVACITLNRPDRLNAWTPRMSLEVRDALHAAAGDDDVRVIILTGAGRGFCAGADMNELEDASDQGLSALDGTEDPEQAVSILSGIRTEETLDPDNRFVARSDFRKRYSYLQSIPKPIIAAINGPAAGLGLIMTLYCDIRFASEKAKFTTAFARRGLIAEHGISWILPRTVGMANALDLLFSARLIDAREALDMGLVNRVMPEATFMEQVMAYATEMAAMVSPRSLGIMKKQIYEAQFQTLAEATVIADDGLLRSLESEDFKEGVAHFLEKRTPNFTGR
jgi:enoyl-CoA hydratase/carnithine racemase